MRQKDILQIVKGYDKENLKTELKQIQKFITEDGNFKHKEMAAILVSFANREGGTLIIGAKDNGELEGGNIFEQFSKSSKLGFDKFKEHVENLCKDIISPRLYVTIQYFEIEQNAVAAISVPRRNSMPHAVVAKHEGTAIRAREYYIRSNHGMTLVNDRQLEWLFQHREMHTRVDTFEIGVTLKDDLTEMPLRITPYAFNIQPDISLHLIEYLTLMSPEKIDSFRQHPETFSVLLGELLVYSILQTQEAHFDKDKALPLPYDKMMMHDVFGDILKPMIHKKKNLWSMPYGTSMKVSTNGEWTRIKFGNRFMIGSLMVKPRYIKKGLNRNNPLSISDEVMTFGYDVSMHTTLKFPEYEEEGYERAGEFGNAIIRHIKSHWDINEHYHKMPNELLIYAVDQKVDRLLEIMRKNELDHDYK